MIKKLVILLMLVFLVACQHEENSEYHDIEISLENYFLEEHLNKKIVLVDDSRMAEFKESVEKQIKSVQGISVEVDSILISGKVKDLTFPIEVNTAKQLTAIEFHEKKDSEPELVSESTDTIPIESMLEISQNTYESIMKDSYNSDLIQSLTLKSWRRKPIESQNELKSYFDYAKDVLKIEVENFEYRNKDDLHYMLGFKKEEPIIVFIFDAKYDLINIDFPIIRYLSDHMLINATSYYSDEKIYEKESFCQLNGDFMNEINTSFVKNIDNVSIGKNIIQDQNWLELYTLMSDSFTSRLSYEDFIDYMNGQMMMLGSHSLDDSNQIYTKMNNLYTGAFFFTSIYTQDYELSYTNRYTFEMPMYMNQYLFKGENQIFENIYVTKNDFNAYENALNDLEKRKRNLNLFIDALIHHDYTYTYSVLSENSPLIEYADFVSMMKAQEKIAGGYDGVMIKKRETYAEDLGVLYVEYLVGDSKGFGRLIFQLNGQEDIISFNVAQVFTVDEPFDEVYLWH